MISCSIYWIAYVISTADLCPKISIRNLSNKYVYFLSDFVRFLDGVRNKLLERRRRKWRQRPSWNLPSTSSLANFWLGIIATFVILRWPPPPSWIWMFRVGLSFEILQLLFNTLDVCASDSLQIYLSMLRRQPEWLLCQVTLEFVLISIFHNLMRCHLLLNLNI